ncbi:malonyl-ACP O-methyltransferase BioC [Brevibacillus sp. NRS-1366]|uniref:malonyl-ACP O-methyltransferase BioC n=1 Tax=Brevibacillus sp. NRS-1366 TaxID=3233899 RepID=UPI003D227D8E
MWKTAVSNRFSEKSDSYEQYALVQKEMAESLHQMIKESTKRSEIQRILEIGCGTGGLTSLARRLFPDADYQAIDLASGMLEKAKARVAQLQLNCKFLQGDAEEWIWRQPERSQDLILSGACFQWFSQPEDTVKGLHRLLAPGASLFFSTFGPLTFCELHDSFAYAHASLGEENVRHGLSFFKASEWRAMLEDTGFESVVASSKKVVLTYPKVRDFLYAVKAVGANTSQEQAAGLGQRKLLIEMMQYYERVYGDGQGIPVTYELLYFHGTRR